MGPLDGFRVIEMAGLGPCPMAGQMLADLGCSVTVIDRASGRDLSADVNRRGKRSIALDLKAPAGRAVMLRLCEHADVLIEGYRPGVMERLGLGPEEVMPNNPGLVYGRMTGWGQNGPLAATAGHDITYLALTGALHAMGEKGRPPVPPLNLVADYGGGSMMLVTGVLAALLERGRSGRGQVIDAAMVDGVPVLMGLLHSMRSMGLWSHDRGENLLDGGAPFYRCYAAGDGKFVAVGALEPQFFAVLVDRTGIGKHWQGIQMDKRHWPEMTVALEQAFLTRNRDEWAELFEQTDGCVAPVLNLDEAAVHPHNVARGTFRRDGHLLQAAPAPRFGRSIAPIPVAGRVSGADWQSVLSDAGYPEPEINTLRNSGAVL
jgi:alpha-methylacyl-CoA racemase